LLAVIEVLLPIKIQVTARAYTNCCDDIRDNNRDVKEVLLSCRGIANTAANAFGKQFFFADDGKGN
ncbi:hypothetical protein M378DRAFT_165667, partial [Amanita muscaria Koide BX008]